MEKLGTLGKAIVKACAIALDAVVKDEEIHAAVATAYEQFGLDPAQALGSAAAASGTSGVPRDLEKLKGFVSEGEWYVNPHGKPKAFRTDKKGNPSDPGYCQGSKTGSCGDDFPSLDTPYAYRKGDQPGGPATVCVGCFNAAGGEATPYVPKNSTPQDTAPAVAENEELPF